MFPVFYGFDRKTILMILSVLEVQDDDQHFHWDTHAYTISGNV